MLHGLFLLSGACGLGYQISWTKLWSVGLGHEVPSMLAVVAAFFGGLALGALWLDRAVSRSSRPARWYVGLEVVLGSWSVATVWLIPWGNGLVDFDNDGRLDVYAANGFLSGPIEDDL